MNRSVAVMLGDGFEIAEVSVPVDMMRRADIDVTTVSVSDNIQVDSGQNVMVIADALANDINLMDFDMIVVPGGNVGVESLSNCAALKEALTAYINEGKWVASICAGPTILANLGLLEGYTATCYPGCEGNFPAGSYRDRVVVVDRNLITAPGPGFAFGFGRAIVEALAGKEMAERIAEGMLL